jgi:beta-N-acetylhexosaminidase
MSDSSLRADVGELLLVGFHGTTLPPAVASALREQRINGTILFTRNIESVEQVADLNAATYDAAGPDRLPFISVDQEGGRVQRLREPFTRLPPMALVGQAGDLDLAAQVGESMAFELEALGFNLDYAPCADVFTNPENTVIGDRAFGTDPETVGRMAGALMLGLNMGGIIPCAKHFPGHGDTLLDSHEALPTIEHGLERLQQVELRPFELLIRGQVPLIMTAHVVVPAVDAQWPATLSPHWLTRILRQQMKYGGVIISDDLEMKAVADRWDIAELAERGLHAGIDIFLVCHTEEKWLTCYDTLVRLGERSSRERDLIALAAGRVRALRHDWLRPWQRPADVRASLGQPLALERIERVRQLAAARA